MKRNKMTKKSRLHKQNQRNVENVKKPFEKQSLLFQDHSKVLYFNFGQSNICFHSFLKISNLSDLFAKNEMLGSRTVHFFYFIRSSYDIDRYIPRYLRVSRWTLRLSFSGGEVKLRAASELSTKSLAGRLVE